MSQSQVTVHSTEIDITDLPTKSVTFAPNRATVTREIENIQTKLGANEIIILGLDPDIDPDSVRVEGYGLATITDTQTEIVPRKQQFEDQFPDLVEDDEDESEDNSTLSDDDYGVDRTAFEKAKSELKSAEATLARYQNRQDTAVKVLSFLDHYGQSIKAEEVDVTKMTDFLTVYGEQREQQSEAHISTSAGIALWTEEVEEARKRFNRAEAAFKKAKDAASREIRRQREKKQREKQQKRREKQRIIQQRRRFWTHNVGQVVVCLDRASEFTPASSRRQSITSVTGPGVDSTPSKPLDEDHINLRLTYVVPSARWAPRYELKISTPKSSADLVYRAEFENTTSETWKNAKITFSTSQTFFSGLDEKIPILDPWHVKLGSVVGTFTKKDVPTSSVQSKKEMMANNVGPFHESKKMRTAFGNTNPANVNLFGSAPTQQQVQQQQQIMRRAQQIQQMQQHQPNQMAQAHIMPRALPPIASSSHARAAPGIAFRKAPTSAADDSDNESEDEADELTLNPEDHSIAHQDSIRQDYGLTTTYDLPGQRTLEPSTVQRRHVIAELHLASIILSHVLIPKLRRAAFLKARITNTTAVSLLRGKAGMTVDGTFLGSTTLPSCEPSHFIDLSLGVDPSILVSYAKPTARRATTGFFSKEDSTIFTRSCWIKNTKKSEVSIIVLDQVPVSEDENLRINILQPKGLDKENDTANLNELFKKGENGKGDVLLGKDGQIKWNIKLRPGKDVKLVLEYESRIPSGQQIVGLD
ncbi:conserved hypothetical protein [Talaromyces stipitatus ATCC 10500]|uniref:Mucoidy inhibitor A n=1 Tax=Talaromyces stipitatus (strain ATCC 10500 / CBS 375.48 / QM 6759 / NRRL 1006) TaxID=441959 RepID=B8MDE3_TALSN|nr:uncharacterized protein TSTA_116940 [Talaromyces stipitatus ATCC 10500]EED17907.1 conserved hypothetical protein [Talaromyces stipitatus ATCC 10500]